MKKTIKSAKDKLNPRQQRFCEEYLIDLNATQAAIRAGYAAHSISKHTGQIVSCSGVQTEIARLKAERSERILVTADNVVIELARLAFSNIEDFLSIDKDGEVYLKNFDGIDREKLAAVESVKINTSVNKDDSRTYTTTQFKLCSKLNALEQLGKHLGIYQKDNIQKNLTIIDIMALIGVKSEA